MKLFSNRGSINRVIVVLLVLIAVMLLIIAFPLWKHFRERSEVIACEQAMKSAEDGLVIEYLSRSKEDSLENAIKTLDQVMVARPKICPSGGEVYLIKNRQGIYEPFCGLHDQDLKRRVRLNASRALDLLEEGLRQKRKELKAEPESVEIDLNNRMLDCKRVSTTPALRRGTGTTNGYDGIVILYGLAGEGDFDAGDLAKGKICFFIYADENYCAIWRPHDGWTGDSYT